MFYPVVDHTFSDSELGRKVGDRKLSGSQRPRYVNLVDMAKPVQPLHRTVVQIQC
jgi:hypothetical protein